MAENNDSSRCFPTTEVITVATRDPVPQVQPPTSPSSQSSLRTFEMDPACRICLERGTEPLVSPCKCAGSSEFAHESCLLKWFFKTRRRRCEICLSEVNVKSVGFKPLQKWRLPTDSCDFVFYLFSLYCVIMFVFTGMIIWIATQGCLSPVCITLYVICSMSLVYFIYCCGCVEYSKAYWKACVTMNKTWRIYDREESSRAKIQTTRDLATAIESNSSRKPEPHTEQYVVSFPPSEGAYDDCVGEGTSSPHEDTNISSSSLSGSATIIQSFYQAEDTHQINDMSSQISSPFCGSLSSLSPFTLSKELAHTGSMSLLMDLNCITEDPTCTFMKNSKERINDIAIKVDNSEDGDDDEDGESIDDVLNKGQCNRGKVLTCKARVDGLPNKAFDDTKL